MHLKIKSKSLFLPLLGLLMCLSFGGAFGQGETENVSQYRAAYSFTPPRIATEIGPNTNMNPVSTSTVPSDSFGISYIYPPKLQELLDLHQRIVENMVDAPGYRIQIYAGSKLEHANDAKADFLEAFSEFDFPIYQKWQPPHFRVRIGDFLSRSEAMREMAMVRQIFPDAFIVADIVKLPKYKKQVVRPGDDLGPNEIRHN